MWLFLFVFAVLQETLVCGWKFLEPMLLLPKKDGQRVLACARLVDCLARTSASAVGVVDAKGLRNTMVVPAIHKFLRQFTNSCRNRATPSEVAADEEEELLTLWAMSKTALVLIMVRL
jgi:hypothetical protein